MHIELVQIKTSDGLLLPGIFSAPEKTSAAAIYLHGNGSSSVFYKEDYHALFRNALARRGIALLQFNNRGAHYIKQLRVRRQGREELKRYGMAYEKIKDCVYDIDAAVSFLRKRGYKTFYLTGLSTGANKICVYHYYKPRNAISKNVLLGGGDDAGIYYHLLQKKKFWPLLAKAKRRVSAGTGEDIMSELLPAEIFSYQGFYDIANPDGDYNVFPFYEVLKNTALSKKPLFRHFQSIKKPTLVVYGEHDEYAWGDVPRIVALLKERKPLFEYKIISGADHACSEHQQELSSVIARWLAL